MNRALPFLDVSIKRPLFGEDNECLEPLKINIYRKPTHANRYLQYGSAHPMDIKMAMVRGLYLRARRLLKDFPAQLSAELAYLRRSLMLPNNGYPIGTLKTWFNNFALQIRLRPGLLTVRSRLNAMEVFDELGQQFFHFPTASDRYPPMDDDDSLEVLPENDPANNFGTGTGNVFGQPERSALIQKQHFDDEEEEAEKRLPMLVQRQSTEMTLQRQSTEMAW